jgi:hypothetical protein
MTTVKAPSNYILNGTAPFTVTLPLDTNFVWDGTSNIAIQFCFNNVNGGGSSTNSANVKSTTTATNLTTYYTADNTATVCSTASGTTSTTRPNMRFGVISGSLVWSPITDLYTNAAGTIIDEKWLPITNPAMLSFRPEGKPDFVTGNISFDDWKSRHESILAPEEVHTASKWYSNIFDNFLNYTNNDQPKAKQLMRSWLVWFGVRQPWAAQRPVRGLCPGAR